MRGYLYEGGSTLNARGATEELLLREDEQLGLDLPDALDALEVRS